MMATKTYRAKKTLLALGVLLASGLTVSQVQADQLADIKAAGVVKVATFDANPPFGSVDAKTHKIVGYDVDFAEALAKSLGVKLELVATNPANRIPLLQSGKADLIVADITITPERAQVINFSVPYFVTGQQFLVPAKSPDKLDEYSKARIGAVKGTTGEQALHQRFPAVARGGLRRHPAGVNRATQRQCSGHYPGQYNSGRFIRRCAG